LYQRRADADYEANFRNCMHVAIGSDTKAAAATVKASPVRPALLAALDDWACTTSDAGRRQWILDVARQSDPESEGWSARIRDSSKWDDPQMALDLAGAVPTRDVPVSTLLIIAERLRQANRAPQTFLRGVQKDHPADFYANLALGDATIVSDSREAEACYRVALAARPEAIVGYCALADSLREEHRFDEAISCYEEALRRQPNYVRAKCGLAAAYLGDQRPNEALATGYESLKLDPDYAWTHYYLAGALYSLGRVDQAIQHYAIVYKDSPEARGVSDAYRAALIQAGKMKDVREIFWDKALQDPDARYEQLKGYPEFCLFTGNVADYRASRATMLDRFGSTTSAQVMQQIACTCLLLPAPQEEAPVLERACDLADRALAGKKPTSGDFACYVFVKALADYRSGDFDSAIKEASGDGSSIMGPCPRLIVAMASKAQGRNADAEHTLAEASVKFDWRMGSADLPEFWVYHILLREAQSRIVPDLSSLIDGSRKPIDNDQRAILMAACQSSHSNRLCAQTFIDAVTIEPHFIESRRPNPRFVAACASYVLALCDENSDQRHAIESNPDALRELACQSLSRALHAQVHQPPMSVPGRNWLSREFASWQRDPGLADLRDSAQWESRTPEFRNECDSLWRLLDHDILVLQGVKPPTPTTRSVPTTQRS
jgi:serine/threonine-protein kinase